jgi:hypothetical protein
MLAEREDIETQFNELVSQLDQLLAFHVGDPIAALEIDRLRAAREKAVLGAQVARRLVRTVEK